MKRWALVLFSLGIGCVLSVRAQTPPVTTGYIYPVETTNKRVWIIGQRPLNQQGQLVGRNNIDQQLTQVFANIRAALKSINLTSADIKQITYHVRQLDKTRSDLIRTAQTQSLPIQNGVITQQKNVAQLAGNDTMVEVEVIAVTP